MRDMNLQASIPVRIDADVRKQLDILSDQCGLTVSNLIRMAIDEFVQRIKDDGAISIPIEINGHQIAAFGGIINNGVKHQKVAEDSAEYAPRNKKKR